MTSRTSWGTLLAVSFYLIAGCSNGGSAGEIAQNIDSPKDKIAKLEESGAIPKLDRGPDLAGPDDNANEVRDDIERYIDDTYKVPSQHAAAMQFARSIQRALLVDVTNVETVKAVNRGMSEGIHCLFSRFNNPAAKQPEQVSAEIRSLTTNTKSRLLAYLAFSHALDGTSWALPEGDTCE